MLSGRIEKYAKYSQFNTLNKFNITIEMFLADHKYDFTKGELVAFKRLTKYCAKFFGIANAKIGTILKTINEESNGHGVSRRTFERMITKAVELGILIRKHTIKVKGGQGHNVYIFQKPSKNGVPKMEILAHRQNAETLTDSKDEQPKKEREAIDLLETNNIKRLSKRIDTSVQTKLDHTYVSDSVPKEFVNLVKHFYDNSQTIEEYWKMVKIDTYNVRNSLNNEEILDTAKHSFKQMIGRVKKGKVRNPIAYFKRVLHKQITDLYTVKTAPITEDDGYLVEYPEEPSKRSRVGLFGY